MRRAKAFQQRFGDADYRGRRSVAMVRTTPTPKAFLVPVFAGGANPLMYGNAAVDALFGQAESELDNAKVSDFYGQAQRIIIDDDTALVPLFHRGINILVSRG